MTDENSWISQHCHFLPRLITALSVMLINTAFSHCIECCPHFLVIAHQTQARDDINGLMQERRNSIANVLEYVSIAPSPPPPPPPPPPITHTHTHTHTHTLLFPPSVQWNQYDNALSFCFYHWSMYSAYSITLYCTATNRDHIATVKFVIHNHFQYLHWLLKSNWRCPVTQRCSLDMSLILCYSNVSTPSSDYLKMVGMDKYAQLFLDYVIGQLYQYIF